MESSKAHTHTQNADDAVAATPAVLVHDYDAHYAPRIAGEYIVVFSSDAEDLDFELMAAR